MTRLVHLTDLHFGLHRLDLVTPLYDAVLSTKPDVVVVSGDLTQRALPRQYADAMAFVRGFNLPFLVIPGNHDLPAFNPLKRLIRPFGPFRRRAARNLTPTLQIGRLQLFGVNTADPLSWRGGVARQDEIDLVCKAMQNGPPDAINIAVCHHPLEEPPGFERGETRDARLTMEKFGKAGMHVALSGHLHHWTTGLGITDQIKRPILQVQTGTALCARARERDHGFSVMDFDTNIIALTPWIVDETALQFLPRPELKFHYANGQWGLVS